LAEAPNEQTISLPPALQMELAAAQAAWLARSARQHSRPNAARDLPAIRPAVFAFDRTGPQGRAE
jgi:hypothetical protein